MTNFDECSNIRGTQFKHDDTFGPRYNPIEDLVKVSSFFYFYQNLFLEVFYSSHTLFSYVKKAGLKYTEDKYDDYTFRFKVQSL